MRKERVERLMGKLRKVWKKRKWLGKVKEGWKKKTYPCQSRGLVHLVFLPPPVRPSHLLVYLPHRSHLLGFHLHLSLPPDSLPRPYPPLVYRLRLSQQARVWRVRPLLRSRGGLLREALRGLLEVGRLRLWV